MNIDENISKIIAKFIIGDLSTEEEEILQSWLLEYYNPLLYPSLVIFANKYVRDDSLSEEIAQEVLASFSKNISKIDIHSLIKSYLYTAVRNSAINHLEKKVIKEKHVKACFDNKNKGDDYESN